MIISVVSFSITKLQNFLTTNISVFQAEIQIKVVSNLVSQIFV